uniref:Peptidase S1 domain-containing protein n=1 Tax=Hucho hucho TaxID=62062 RepID=A0A4W5QCL5_9TELE
MTPKSKAVQQIPLLKKDQDKANPFWTVAGWGAIKIGGSANAHLLQVNVTVVDRSSCQRSNLITLFQLSLQGDSGGPLVCKGTAVGVVSFNQQGNCNKPQKPNVYTKISTYISWIIKYH